MSNKKFRQLRKAVANLTKTWPKSLIEVHVVEYISGKKLREEGMVNTPGGELILSERYYKTNKVTLKRLDHYNEAKKFFAKYGEEECLQKYIDWFQIHHEKMVQKYQHLFNNPTEHK